MIGQRVYTEAPNVTGTNKEGLERPEKWRRKAVYGLFVLFLITFGGLSFEGECCRVRSEYGETRR